MKKNNIVTKTISQIFLYALELFAIAGVLTFLSCRVFGLGGENRILTILERFILFYGIYQLMVFIILNNLNDIKADEFLALNTASKYAILAVESGENKIFSSLEKMVEEQLDSGIFNDLKVRKEYLNISQAVENKNIIYLRWLEIHSGHCYEESKLNWKYSFILRLVK